MGRGDGSGGGGIRGMLFGLRAGKKSAAAIDHLFRFRNGDEVLQATTGALGGSATPGVATAAAGASGGGGGA